MTMSIKSICTAGTLAFSLSLLGGSVAAAPGDPSGGACDSLEPSGGLYSTCIQAHSARNRIAHLSSTRASANAVQQAQNALNALLAQYASLGGGVVPGFEPTCPCWDATELASIDGISPTSNGSRLQCVVSPTYLYLIGESAYTQTNNDQSGAYAEVYVEAKECRFNSSNSAGVPLVSRFIENLTDAEVNACATQVVARTITLGLACAGGI